MVMTRIAVEKLAQLIAEKICADGFVPAAIIEKELRQSIAESIETFFRTRGEYQA